LRRQKSSPAFFKQRTLVERSCDEQGHQRLVLLRQFVELGVDFTRLCLGPQCRDALQDVVDVAISGQLQLLLLVVRESTNAIHVCDLPPQELVQLAARRCGNQFGDFAFAGWWLTTIGELLRTKLRSCAGGRKKQYETAQASIQALNEEHGRFRALLRARYCTS